MQIPQSNVSVIRPDLNSSVAPFRPRRTIQTANMRAVEFDVLMTAHQPGVLRAARRLLRDEEDAKDAVQEVFLRLLVGRSNVQGDPGAWLYRVTVNFCNIVTIIDSEDQRLNFLYRQPILRPTRNACSDSENGNAFSEKVWGC